MVLASDKLQDPDILAMNGAACALFISPLPFDGPIASVRVGRVAGRFVAFPSQEDLEESDLDLIVSGSEREVAMIEGFAREVPEGEMLEAIRFAHSAIRDIISLQREFYEKVQPQKNAFTASSDDGLYDRVKSRFYDELRS